MMLAGTLCKYLSRPRCKKIYLETFVKRKRILSFLCKDVRYYTTSSMNQEPVKFKLDQQLFQSILTPETLIVRELFKENGYEIRVVGGVVRDLLMGKAADDLDLCTTATPTEMKEMYETAGIRVLTLAGEKHGTVSIRVNDKQNFEVTTLRVDIKTDGRHAIVQFTKDWRLDALRRDLTINSLFLDFEGFVHDYFNGIEDIRNRKVRFVDDPNKRIQEDYLRILRYFRFYGRIASHPNRHEDGILDSIQQNAKGLANVSGQRIWTELRKIVVGRYADSIVRTMVETGVSKHIGFPDDINLEEFSQVVQHTADNQPNAMTRIAALFTDQVQLEEFHSRVLLSNREKSLCTMILKYRNQVNISDLDSITEHYSLDVDTPRKQFKEEMIELCKYKGNTQMATKLVDHEFPFCPVGMNILSSLKRIRRKYSSMAMEYLCRRWVDSGYSMNQEELLKVADQFIEENKDKYDNLLYTVPKKIKGKK